MGWLATRRRQKYRQDKKNKRRQAFVRGDNTDSRLPPNAEKVRPGDVYLMVGSESTETYRVKMVRGDSFHYTNRRGKINYRATFQGASGVFLRNSKDGLPEIIAVSQDFKDKFPQLRF